MAGQQNDQDVQDHWAKRLPWSPNGWKEQRQSDIKPLPENDQEF
jgi:hypothetical protein